MKTPQMWLFAASPFAIGYLINYGMLRFNWYGTVITAFSALFFAYWFFAGRLSVKWTRNQKEALLTGNSFAAICAALIIFQELVLKRYLPNLLGILPQMFFLPALRLCSQIEQILMFFRTPHQIYLWRTVFFAFVLMILTYHAGHLSHRKKQ